MIVGIDVHKQSHAAALIDDRGGLVDALTIANSPKGFRQLIDWLVDRDAASAVIGVESPGSYGRCLVAALAGAGFEVLQVPAWRTHRERHRRGPGKTDPGDALSIAKVVMTDRADLGPAQEPELVRALGMLELQRRRFVHDRTQAIQRLRSDWTQFDPVAEAGDDPLRPQARAAQAQADHARRQPRPAHRRPLPSRARRATSTISTTASPSWTPRSQSCSPSTAARSNSSTASAATSPPSSSPKPATFAASATPARSPASAAPHRSPAAPERPQDDTACTAAATANSTPRSTASPSFNNATTPKPRPSSTARSAKARHHEKPAAPSNATSPTSSTATSSPGPTPPPP